MVSENTVAIVNARIVTSSRVIEDGVVIIRDGSIAECGEGAGIELPARCERIDARGNYVGPGFIDLHCHGGGGWAVWDKPYEVACFHLQHGTTTLLPGLSYNRSRAQWTEDVTRILGVGERPFRNVIAGLHMEGPYINPKYGAITSPIRPVDPVEYRELMELGGDSIKIWTLAPELEGQNEFVEAASARGIVLSVGHSEASAETIFSLVPKGLRLGCHCTCATGTTPSPTRYAGTREMGVDEAVWLHDEIYAEVIPDEQGLHVRPLMCKLIHKVKGTDRTIIITDAIAQAGLIESDSVDNSSPGQYKDVRFIEGVGLSGSKLTMNRAVRNMMRHADVGVVEAFVMAALNPARLLKIDHLVGSIEKGKRANLVVVTEEMEVEGVVFEGKWLPKGFQAVD